ncbi:hypothetical protein Hanom_Chr10g00909851 [Helianthus anomalus]
MSVVVAPRPNIVLISYRNSLGLWQVMQLHHLYCSLLLRCSKQTPPSIPC